MTEELIEDDLNNKDLFTSHTKRSRGRFASEMNRAHMVHDSTRTTFFPSPAFLFSVQYVDLVVLLVPLAAFQALSVDTSTLTSRKQKSLD